MQYRQSLEIEQLTHKTPASSDVDRQKDISLDEISRRLEQQTTYDELFTLRWRVQ